MTFQLRTFQGVRPALFNFNTAGQPGGYADFDNYTVEEPRARGIEREIPAGQERSRSPAEPMAACWPPTRRTNL